jgi:hypothetical protein
MQLPEVLPDESLFSRICRYLTQSNALRDESLKHLLGDERAAIHPYLTSGLVTISKFTTETPSELLLTQTLRPLFAFFLPKYSSIIQDQKVNSSELIRACQISTFREREQLNIKHCPLCAAKDIYTHGVAYWHCAQQLSGVESCSKHAIWLIHNELPSRIHLSPDFLPCARLSSQPSNSLAREFAQYVEHYISLVRSGKLVQSSSDRYGAELKRKGFQTASGRTRRLQFYRGLYEFAAQILPANNPLLPKSPEDFSYFSALLASSFNQHPFKHLLLNFYLSHHTTAVEGESIPKVERIPGIEGYCCALLKAGVSMAQTGREIGKSRCYVKAVALKNAIPVNLRPKIITREVKQVIIKMAYKGFNRNAIAQFFDISSGSVELIISSIDGLVEWRKRCKAESFRRRYKCQILRFIEHNPTACRQEIKFGCEAAFYWLYTHEHSWLEANLPKPQPVVRVDKVDWEKRDIELSEKIITLVERAENPMTRTALERTLVISGWLTSKKSRFPNTFNILKKHGWI